MIGLLWVLAALFSLLAVLLILPFRVEIDTEREVFEAKWVGVFGIRAVPGAERWRWFFQVFFFEKEWLPKMARPKPAKPKAAEKPISSKKKPPFSLRQMWQLAKNMLRAIDVKRFHLNWDTGDFVQNAWLYPVFQFLSRGNRQLRINFLGKQDISILLQTRLCRVAWAFLKIIFHTKFNKQ